MPRRTPERIRENKTRFLRGGLARRGSDDIDGIEATDDERKRVDRSGRLTLPQLKVDVRNPHASAAYHVQWPCAATGAPHDFLGDSSHASSRPLELELCIHFVCEGAATRVRRKPAARIASAIVPLTFASSTKVSMYSAAAAFPFDVAMACWITV